MQHDNFELVTHCNNSVEDADTLSAATIQDSPPRQRQLSSALDGQALADLKQRAHHNNDRARLAHLELNSAPNAGQWLHPSG